MAAMSDRVLFTFQIAGFVLGLLSICAGLFLYEDETGKIQSRLEDLWIRIDDQSKDKLTKHKRFVSEVAVMTNRLIDRLFAEDNEESNRPEYTKPKKAGKAKANRGGQSTYSKPLPYKRSSP